MKKLLVVLGLLIAPSIVMADLGDLIKATLLDHVDTMVIYELERDEQKLPALALVDSIFTIGTYEGSGILDIQGGFFGYAEPSEGDNQVANWIAGGQLRIDTFLRSKLPLPDHWLFLKALEHGPVAYYDFTNKEPILGYAVGLSFDLDPNIP